MSSADETARLQSLALAARDGDGRAYEELFRATQPRLVRMALAFGAPPEDAPDLAQEALLGAWRNLADFDPERGTFLAWIAGGLRGRAINLHRGDDRRDRFVGRLQSSFGDLPSENHRGEAIEARMTLSKLLQCLSQRQREVVALYELGGLSGLETALLLGIGEAAVRSIARDAREALKKAAREIEAQRLSPANTSSRRVS